MDGMNRTGAAGGFSNRKAQASLPVPLPAPLRLNLGCGRDVREGFVNVDLFSDEPAVVQMDISRLELPDECADYVLASDVLEHFPHRRVPEVLREWARVLKPGGIIEVRCPSLRLQMQAYLRGDWSADVASYMIFGGQTNPGDYHCVGFDETSIQVHLAKAGFEVFELVRYDFPQDKGFINLNMAAKARKKPRSNAEGEGLGIVWEGTQFKFHSLALVNREHCFNLVRSGLPVRLLPYEQEDFSPIGNQKYEALARCDERFSGPLVAPPAPIWIRHTWPPMKTRPVGAGKWVVMQPWEYTAIPTEFVDIFKQTDEVWTPSHYCRASFVNSGVAESKVHVVPNGIDPAVFKPTGSRYPVATRKRFRFLFVGGTIARKGIDILLSAYTKVFTANEDVCLVIKDMGGGSFYRGQTAQEMITRLANLPNAPEIEYIDRMLDESEIPALYRSCHAFVSPYRGEGFCLPALEAMACGLPVIVTEGGATDDFVDESVGWRVPARLVSIGHMVCNMPAEHDVGFLEPDVEALAAKLQDVVTHPELVIEKGLRAQYRARREWTWEQATRQLLSRIEVLSGVQMTERKAKLSDSGLDADGWLGLAFSECEQGELQAGMQAYMQAIRLGDYRPEFAAVVLQSMGRHCFDDAFRLAMR